MAIQVGYDPNVSVAADMAYSTGINATAKDVAIQQQAYEYQKMLQDNALKNSFQNKFLDLGIRSALAGIGGMAGAGGAAGAAGAAGAVGGGSAGATAPIVSGMPSRAAFGVPGSGGAAGAAGAAPAEGGGFMGMLGNAASGVGNVLGSAMRGIGNAAADGTLMPGGGSSGRYSSAQRASLAKYQNSMSEIQQNKGGMFSPSEQVEAMRRVQARAWGISPLPMPTEQSKYAKGQEVGDYWKDPDSGVMLTRKENGDVSRLADNPLVPTHKDNIGYYESARTQLRTEKNGVVTEGSAEDIDKLVGRMLKNHSSYAQSSIRGPQPKIPKYPKEMMGPPSELAPSEADPTGPMTDENDPYRRDAPGPEAGPADQQQQVEAGPVHTKEKLDAFTGQLRAKGDIPENLIGQLEADHDKMEKIDKETSPLKKIAAWNTYEKKYNMLKDYDPKLNKNKPLAPKQEVEEKAKKEPTLSQTDTEVVPDLQKRLASLIEKNGKELSDKEKVAMKMDARKNMPSYTSGHQKKAFQEKLQGHIDRLETKTKPAFVGPPEKQGPPSSLAPKPEKKIPKGTSKSTDLLDSLIKEAGDRLSPNVKSKMRKDLISAKHHRSSAARKKLAKTIETHIKSLKEIIGKNE